MIQLGILRDNKGFQFCEGWNYENIEAMFKGVEADLIGEKFLAVKEQYNIFFTVAHHLEGTRSKKAFKCQEHVAFDLDGIDLDKIDEYFPLFCEVLKLDPEKTACVYSGNGIHIYVRIPEMLKDPVKYKSMKTGYKLKCQQLEKKFTEAGLPLKVDPTCWDVARILRVPFTRNLKIKNGEVHEKGCELKQGKCLPQEFELQQNSESLPSNHFLQKGQFPKPDPKAILEGCDFFKWLQTTPEQVHEPHMYAMLSITAHFHDNNDTSFRLMSSFSSPSIDRADKAEKIEQAVSASGPRTCAGIDDIYGKCQKCPYYGKITSPILLKGDEHIGTEHMGFTLVGPKGSIKRQYGDLLLAYDQEFNHKTVGVMKKTYVFTGTHYRMTNDIEMKYFAGGKFIPLANENEVNEFKNLVVRTNYTHDGVFDFADTAGLINLKNGILDVQSRTLKPHTKDIYFTSCLDFNFNADAKCPTWDRFIDEVTCGRKCLQNILHEYLGFIISGSHYKYQKALILDGSGKNGKTTFLKILKKLVGFNNISTVSIADLSKSVFASSSLHNKLCNISEEEPPESFKHQSGTFKNLTGDGTITAQYKYGDLFQFDNLAKLVISYNEMPYIADTTTGMLRRLLITPWDYDLEGEHASKVDPDIEIKLYMELEGIFLRCLDGFDRLERQRGFTKSKFVDERVQGVKEYSDNVADFLVNGCNWTKDPKDYVELDEVFAAFELFNEDERTGNKITKATFSKRLIKNKIAIKRTRINGKKARICHGIILDTPSY